MRMNIAVVRRRLQFKIAQVFSEFPFPGMAVSGGSSVEFAMAVLLAGAAADEILCCARVQQIPFRTQREDFPQILCFIKVREDGQFAEAAWSAVRLCAAVFGR